MLIDEPDYKHRHLVEADIEHDQNIIAMISKVIPDKPRHSAGQLSDVTRTSPTPKPFGWQMISLGSQAASAFGCIRKSDFTPAVVKSTASNEGKTSFLPSTLTVRALPSIRTDPVNSMPGASVRQGLLACPYLSLPKR